MLHLVGSHAETSDPLFVHRYSYLPIAIVAQSNRLLSQGSEVRLSRWLAEK